EKNITSAWYGRKILPIRLCLPVVVLKSDVCLTHKGSEFIGHQGSLLELGSTGGHFGSVLQCHKNANRVFVYLRSKFGRENGAGESSGPQPVTGGRFVVPGSKPPAVL